MPEHEFTDLEDRQAVHLADAFTVGVDQQRVAFDGIDDLGLDTADPSNRFVDRFDDILGINDLDPALPCPIIGLHQ